MSQIDERRHADLRVLLFTHYDHLRTACLNSARSLHLTGRATAMLSVHRPHEGLIAGKLTSRRHDFIAATANERLHLLWRWFECPVRAQPAQASEPGWITDPNELPIS